MTNTTGVRGRRREVPLSDDYREEPVWWRDAGLPDIAPAPLSREADVAIIGAGYTGLCAALTLARHGKRVVVVDTDATGRGASGRNAGMIHAGLRRNVDWLEQHRGAAGAALHAASVDAVRYVAATAAEIHADAGFEERGWLYLAHRPSAMRRLGSQEQMRRERLGETTVLFAPDALAQETEAHGFHGALLTNNGASIHPARYLAALARAAIATGVQVHEHVAVTNVERRPEGGFTVIAPGATLAARDVLVASNGYTDAAVPALRRRVIPIGSYIIATEPLDDAHVAAISPTRRMMSDTRNFLHYWRLTPDRRMLFGGRTSFNPVSLERARGLLYAAMLDMYPHLDGVRVSRAWSGLVGFTFDQMPHLGQLGGITYALGYCGSGVAMGSRLGALAGQWLATGEAPVIARMPFPTLPGYTGRPWFLPLAGAYYQLRDLI